MKNIFASIVLAIGLFALLDNVARADFVQPHTIVPKERRSIIGPALDPLTEGQDGSPSCVDLPHGHCFCDMGASNCEFQCGCAQMGGSGCPPLNEQTDCHPDIPVVDEHFWRILEIVISR